MISSRYAKALLSVAKEHGKEDEVYQEIKNLSDTFTFVPKLKDVLENPVVSLEKKEQLLSTAGGVKVSDLYVRFIKMILEHKREFFLPFIAQVYIHFYRNDKKVQKVLFSTAVPVNNEVKEHLSRKLKEETGCSIEFEGNVDPELLGGFRLRIGNYRIDASYATQLRDIRSRLLENR